MGSYYSNNGARREEFDLFNDGQNDKDTAMFCSDFLHNYSAANLFVDTIPIDSV